MRILIIILVFGFTSCAKSPVHSFINEVKKEPTAIAMTIPGWLIRTGTNLSLKGVDNEDQRAIISLGNNIKELRFVADIKSTIPTHRLRQVIDEMRNDDYESYTTVQSKDAKVYVMVQEEKNKIKNLAILVHGDQSVVVMNIKSNLTFAELKSANFTWNKNKTQEN